MKKLKLKKVAIALAISSLGIFATGCGSSASGVAGVPAVAVNNTAAGGCMPLSGPISFSASNVYIDSMTIKAGTIPSGLDTLRGPIYGSNYIDELIGGAPQLLPQYGTYFRQFGTSAVGGVASVGTFNTTKDVPHPAALSLNVISQTPRTDFPGIRTGSIAGTVTLDAYTQMALMSNTMASNYYSPYGTMPQLANTTCVFQVALSMSYANNIYASGKTYNNVLYNGRIFLFLRTATGTVAKVYIPI